MPALICRCLQALAEALKINKSITNIDLYRNQIGDEGAKAWCVVGSAESLNAAACHDVMFSTSSYEKFGWFAGAVVSSFISDRVELSNTPNPAACHTVCRCWMKPWISGLFFHVLNRRDSTCLSWMSFFDFFLSISEIRFCLKGPRTKRQPWSVSVSRPWPRRWRQTRPSRTSLCHRTRLATRGSRPGVWWAPQNRWMLRHVMMSCFRHPVTLRSLDGLQVL